MAGSVRAAVKVGVDLTELRDIARPVIGSDDALLRVEAAGVCGSDPSIYRRPGHGPAILGHENVGVIEELGELAARRWGVRAGDRVAVEEYLPCWHCAWCLAGDFRICPEADMVNPDMVRFGMEELGHAPGLWGGFAEYCYLPHNTVMHRVDPSVPGDQATLAIPLGNGIQWACYDGGAGPGKTVLVMGPGQQGLGCAIAARGFGAEQVIISGMSRDAKRLDVALRLGADATIDVEQDDLVDKVMELTGGRGVDVVVDTTSDTTGENARIALAVASRKQATLVLQGTGPVDGFPLGEVKKKYATVRSIRGHSYAAVEQALRWITAGRFPFAEMCTSTYGLDGVHTAIKATAGIGVQDAIHVTVDPWIGSAS